MRSGTGQRAGASNTPDRLSVLNRIVSNGLCVGCGMCAGLLPDKLRMVVDEYGAYLPELASEEAAPGWEEKSLRVCPFGDRDENEDTIATGLFARQEGIQHRAETGYFLGCFTGHVTDEAVRPTCTSGGLITWLIGDMLGSGAADAAVCVARSDAPDRLFEYRIIKDPADVERCRKSRYYPIEVSQVIPEMVASKDKVVFVGLPCFLKALRYAMMEDPVLRERVVGTIGLFCGHLKTRHYAAYLSRCCGVHEKDIVTVDFRKKVPGRKSWDYAFEVTTRRGGQDTSRQVSMQKVFAGSWSFNLFMLNACDCCDDVLAETADVAVGDAWLPEYMQDWRGTNMIVCRSRAMLERLERGIERGELHLQTVPPDEAIASQKGGLRHRRPGLSYRLHLAARRRRWRPRKRVKPDRRALPLFRRIIQRLRMRTSKVSHEAFLRQRDREGIAVFVRALYPWVQAHDKLYWIVMLLRRFWRNLRRWISLLR